MDNNYHNDSNQNEFQNVQHPSPVIQQVDANHKKTRPMKSRWLSLLSAGVIGSVITIFATPVVNEYISPLFSEEKAAPIENVEATANTKTSFVEVEQSTSKTTALTEMIEEASKAIVGVVNLQQARGYFPQSTTQSVESGTGSGVLFKKDGNEAYIVTNYHVIENASEIEVSLYNGEKEMAEVVGTDPLTDLAVLKIQADHVSSVLPFGDSSTLKPGEEVVAIGNPLGLEFSRTVTQGIISGTERSISVSTADGKWDLNVIQTDAAINPGNSGGALLNTDGQVIGINSLKISKDGVEGLGFAIPSNDVVPIINELIEKGDVIRPYIGVSLVDVSEIPMYYIQNSTIKVETGTMVAKVDPNSGAAKAGLQEEDVIVGIDNVEVHDANDLRKYLYSEVSIGDEVELKVNRNGKVMSIKVILTE